MARSASVTSVWFGGDARQRGRGSDIVERRLSQEIAYADDDGVELAFA